MRKASHFSGIVAGSARKIHLIDRVCINPIDVNDVFHLNQVISQNLDCYRKTFTHFIKYISFILIDVVSAVWSN